MTNKTSSQITNSRNDATDNGNVEGGVVRVRRGSIISGATDASGTIQRFLRVPSNAVVSQVLFSTAAATGGAVDIGVYQPAEAGGAVIDADFFASALAITAALNRSDQTFESGVYAPALRMQPLWQALGLAADPGREFDIATTITTTYNGASTTVPQLMEVTFTI